MLVTLELFFDHKRGRFRSVSPKLKRNENNLFKKILGTKNITSNEEKKMTHAFLISLIAYQLWPRATRKKNS